MTESQVLKRLDFPAYCVRVLDNGLVAIAGGGGTSKTGVGNSIELGLIDYSSAQSQCHAQFQSIHTFEPQDAIMKFISFSVDKSTIKPINGKIKLGKSKLKQNSNNEQLIEPEFDSNKSDLFIAAIVNSSIEIYKVHPIIDKHSTNLTTKRTRTNSNSSTPNTQSNVRQRHNSSRKNSGSMTQTDGIRSKNLQASANLILQKSIHIDQIINENEHDMTLSEPEQKNKPPKKLSQSLNTSKYDEETMDSLAVCQVKTITKNNILLSNRILLCTGTSKGNICIWELVMQSQKSSRFNDSNNNSNLLNEMPIKCMKVKVFKEAHGKYEIDELQVNNEQNQLLSIGKDNKCIIWSLSGKIEKHMEIDYVAILKDSNLRMKHARFAQKGDCMYTTYIPRIRGGGRDMSSYIHRWNTKNPDSYKVLKTHRIRNTVITSIQASKDGECLCLGDYEGQIYLFDANFNKLVNYKKQHSSVVTDLAFYHDSSLSFNSNKLILSLSIDRTLQCYTYLDTSNKNRALLSLGKTSSIEPFMNLAKKFINKLHLNSMNTFRVFILLSLGVLVFCYFFTFFEI